MQAQTINIIWLLISGTAVFLILVLAFIGSLLINNRRLRKEWDFISSIFDTTAAFIIAIDNNGIVTEFNKACEIITGILSKEIIGKSYDQIHLIPPDLISEKNEVQVLDKENSSTEMEYSKNAIDKSKRIISWSKTHVRNSNNLINTTICTGIDITDRKLAEEKFKHSEEQLRALAAHIQSIRENERAHLSREIHDDLGQSLTAMKMDIKWIEKNISTNKNILIDKINSLLSLTDDTIQKVKIIATELRPGILDDLGLASAIEWQTDEFQKRTNINCKITILPEDFIVSEEISVQLFRVFQETLTNIMRHANANNVEICLFKETDKLRFEVTDDGIGISNDQIQGFKSLGLLGIKERIRQLNGTVNFEGFPGKGTKIKVIVPLKN